MQKSFFMLIPIEPFPNVRDAAENPDSIHLAIPMCLLVPASDPPSAKELKLWHHLSGPLYRKALKNKSPYRFALKQQGPGTVPGPTFGAVLKLRHLIRESLLRKGWQTNVFAPRPFTAVKLRHRDTWKSRS